MGAATSSLSDKHHGYLLKRKNQEVTEQRRRLWNIRAVTSQLSNKIHGYVKRKRDHHFVEMDMFDEGQPSPKRSRQADDQLDDLEQQHWQRSIGDVTSLLSDKGHGYVRRKREHDTEVGKPIDKGLRNPKRRRRIKGNLEVVFSPQIDEISKSCPPALPVNPEPAPEILDSRDTPLPVPVPVPLASALGEARAIRVARVILQRQQNIARRRHMDPKSLRTVAPSLVQARWLDTSPETQQCRKQPRPWVPTLAPIQEDLLLWQDQTKATASSTKWKWKHPRMQSKMLPVGNYAVWAEEEGFDVTATVGNIGISLAGMFTSDVETLRERLWERLDRPASTPQWPQVPPAPAEEFSPIRERFSDAAVVRELEVFEGRTGRNAWDVADTFITSFFSPPLVLAKAIERNSSHKSLSPSEVELGSRSDPSGGSIDTKEVREGYGVPYIRLYMGWALIASRSLTRYRL